MKSDAESRAELSWVRHGLQGSGPKLGSEARGMIGELSQVLGLEGKARPRSQKQAGTLGKNPDPLPFLGAIPAEGVPRGWS